MLLLPAQTSHRCFVRGCTRRPTIINTFATKVNGVTRISTMDNGAQYRCTHHALPAEVTVYHIRADRGGGEMHDITYAEPMPRLCWVCGSRLGKHGCERLARAKYHTAVPFSCDCTTCVVYGGDCWRSLSRDGMYDTIKEHERVYALKVS